MNKLSIFLICLLFLGIDGYSQTLQTVLSNGNSSTLPIKLFGRVDLGEEYDPVQYGAVQIARPTNQGTKFHLSFIRNASMIYGIGFLNNSDSFAIQPGSSNVTTEGIFMNINGNVGIGTSDPKGYRLAVAGSMIAESVKVKLRSAWSDHVFAKEYKLPSLSATEKQIKEEGHLPGIPSAGEVKAHGIDLGEMNAKLLLKIEELTLYLIQQNKSIQAQNVKLEAQQKEIDKLKIR